MNKPNVLWIYCDELRTDALGCYGHDRIHPLTPHIDSLAEHGTIFENCFCNSPVCVPSRVATLTGRYPEETGVYHNEAAWPGYRMPTPVVTFPQVLSANGYATANFGKWHVPSEMNHWDVCDAAGSSMEELLDIVGRDHPRLLVPNGAPTYLGGTFPADVPYPHDTLVERTMAWMAQAQQPFLARISFLEPHTPVFPPSPFDTLYPPTAFRDHHTPAEGRSAFERRFADVVDASNFGAEEIQRAQSYYYGLTAWIDSQVGRLLAYLDGAGLTNNTIVVFDADHGASMGEGGCWAKQIFAPQVHRVPRLIQWENTLPGGVRRHDITEGLDLARTLFGLCGIKAPDSFRGRDLFFEEPPKAVFATIGFGLRESQTFPYLRYGEYTEGAGWPRRACVRTSDYRLDKTTLMNGREPPPEEQDVFLADVRTDPGETRNLAGDPAYRAVREELLAMLNDQISGALESDMGAVYANFQSAG